MLNQLFELIHELLLPCYLRGLLVASLALLNLFESFHDASLLVDPDRRQALLQKRDHTSLILEHLVV